MSGDLNPTGVVSYSIKDLLAEIKAGLDRLEGRLDGKADHTDLVEVRARVEKIEQELAYQVRSSQRATEWRHWAIPALCGLVAVVVSILQLLGRR